MAEISNYLENQIINHMLRGADYTPPAKLYLALYTVAPTDAGGGTEVSSLDYARQEITLTEATTGQSSNSSDITFPKATEDWGTVVAVGILDAETEGNLLMYSNLENQREVYIDDILTAEAGSIVVAFD